MELVKPEPLMINGRAHFTLSSYEPVSIEVEVPQITNEDLAYALSAMVLQEGGGPAEANDDAWVREHFPGIGGVAELRQAVAAQVRLMNAQMADEQKAVKCVSALAQRLMQRIPDALVARTRNAIADAFAMSLAQDGLSEASFLQQTGMSRANVEAMFDEQALEATKQQAAVDAWADHRKLTVSDEEMSQFVGVSSKEEANALIAEARQSGRMVELRALAIRNKAIGLIVAECSCSYRHETDAEARARVAHMRGPGMFSPGEKVGRVQQVGGGDKDAARKEVDAGEKGQGKHPHLRLV